MGKQWIRFKEAILQVPEEACAMRRIRVGKRRKRSALWNRKIKWMAQNMEFFLR